MNVIIKSNDKILVVSPHADDESIGCGGLLSLYGKQCDLILLTDGRKGHTTEIYCNEKMLVQTRKKEFMNAAKLAGVDNIVFLDIEDGKVYQNKSIIYNCNITKYDYIFVPNKYESHMDHRIVLSIIKKMKRKQHANAIIFEYEVWTPLRHATWYLDISSVAEKKRQMISQYISQLADINYVEKGMALSCYRGMFNNTTYSEAYLYSEFYGIRKWLYTLLPKGLKLKVKKVINK